MFDKEVELDIQLRFSNLPRLFSSFKKTRSLWIDIIIKIGTFNSLTIDIGHDKYFTDDQFICRQVEELNVNK